MNRKLMLSKEALLWETGDPARNIAVLEQGKLGVRGEKGLIGLIAPKMILGETAILTLEGQSPRRTATVYALEDNTMVTEYSATLVKQLFDSGDPTITPMIFNSLIGQMGKHCILIVSANKSYPVIQAAMGDLLKGVAQSAKQLDSIRTWDAFMRTFRFMCSMRDNLSELSNSYLAGSSSQSEMVDRASTMIKEMLTEKEQTLVPQIEDFLKAERQRDDWLER